MPTTFSSTLPPLAFAILMATGLSAQPVLQAAPSTRATSEVTLTYPAVAGQAPGTAPPLTIRLDYGQPHLRGRRLHSDSLVPYDVPWRAGANAATRLITDVDLVIGGTTFPKGTYVLFAVPSRTTWKLIVQKNGPQPAVTYDAANDIARVDMRHRTLTEPAESLTLSLVPAAGMGAARGELRISWGNFLVSTDWSVK